MLIIAFFGWGSRRPHHARPGDLRCGSASSSRPRGRWAPATGGSCSSTSCPNVIAPVIVYSHAAAPGIGAHRGRAVVPRGRHPAAHADWGGMIGDATSYYQHAWWYLLLPGLCAADHDPGVQHLRRRRARRVRSAQRPLVREVGGRHMIRFLIKRVLQGVLVMFIVTLAVYLLFFLGDPQNIARRSAGRQATPSRSQNVLHRLGLDRPSGTSTALPLAAAARQPRHRLPQRRAGDHVLKQAAPITFSLAVGRGDDLAGTRRGHRRLLQRPPAVVPGPGVHRARAVLLLDAGVRARLHAALRALLPTDVHHVTHWFPAVRVRRPSPPTRTSGSGT